MCVCVCACVCAAYFVTTLSYDTKDGYFSYLEFRFFIKRERSAISFVDVRGYLRLLEVKNYKCLLYTISQDRKDRKIGKMDLIQCL